MKHREIDEKYERRLRDLEGRMKANMYLLRILQGKNRKNEKEAILENKVDEKFPTDERHESSYLGTSINPT